MSEGAAIDSIDSIDSIHSFLLHSLVGGRSVSGCRMNESNEDESWSN